MDREWLEAQSKDFLVSCLLSHIELNRMLQIRISQIQQENLDDMEIALESVDKVLHKTDQILAVHEAQKIAREEII